MNIVSGGAGFIGSTIVKKLNEKDIEPTIIDNFDNPKISRLLKLKYKLISGDLRHNEFKVDDTIRNIFHCAANPSINDSVNDPIGCVSDALKIINTLCSSYPCSKMIYSSSSAVYGTAIGDENTRSRCISPYAISKVSCEQYLNYLYHTIGYKSMSLRYYNVYGPHQNQGFIYQYIHSAINNKKFVLYGGNQSRDFIYVDDVANINILASEMDFNCEVINVGTSYSHSLLSVIEIINSVIGIKADIEIKEYKSIDIKDSVCNLNKFRSTFKGYQFTKFTDGIKSTFEYIKKEG